MLEIKKLQKAADRGMTQCSCHLLCTWVGKGEETWVTLEALDFPFLPNTDRATNSRGFCHLLGQVAWGRTCFISVGLWGPIWTQWLNSFCSIAVWYSIFRCSEPCLMRRLRKGRVKEKVLGTFLLARSLDILRWNSMRIPGGGSPMAIRLPTLPSCLSVNRLRFFLGTVHWNSLKFFEICICNCQLRISPLATLRPTICG